MKQCLTLCLLMLAFVCVGCGPTSYDHAQSQVAVIAAKEYNKDNFPENGKTGVKDPWGNEITWTMDKNQGIWAHDLVVRSAGKDGLPFTNDDVVVTKAVKIRQDSDEEGVVERGLRGVTRGTIKGIKQGWSWTEKKDQNKKDESDGDNTPEKK